jgi:hypothetical protein
MKRFWTRDISLRAAAAIVALALVASVVTGREEPATDALSPPAERLAPPAANTPQLPDLDLDKLRRPEIGEKIANLFVSRTWMQQPPAAAAAPAVNPAPPPPPPPPTAPALPFRYFGKWVDGERTVVFLWKNSDTHSVSAGDTLEGTYRVESITDSTVDFTYLPLGTRQTLSVSQPQ